MANLLNLPTAEQIDMQNALLASIASHVGLLHFVRIFTKKYLH